MTELSNEYINVKQLRKLYRRGTGGVSNRTAIKLTISNSTIKSLKSLLPFGKGLYGSSFIDLAIRLLFCLVSEPDGIDMVASELKSVCDTGLLVQNLKRLLRYLET